MIKPQQNIFLLFTLLFGWENVHAQGLKPPIKNSISFNVTSCIVNEINLGSQIYLGHRKCLEIDGGIIFVNDFLQEQTKNWNSAQAFSEHGYAVRAHYKIFTSAETKKWQDYISPGLIFKNLYYNEQWFTNVLTNSKDQKYFERIYQSRTRMKLGLEFVWGKVYDLNNVFSFDFFYGGGIVANFVERTILKTIPDSRKNLVEENNTISKSTYFRPNATVGLKLRVRL